MTTSPPSEPLGRTLFNTNVAELGDSEGARRRMDAVRGENVLARVKTCGDGFNIFEGIEWLIDGTKFVGGSYLVKGSLVTLQKLMYTGDLSPYTHEKHLVPLYRDILLVFEDVREPEQTTSIARRTLWEYNNRTARSFPHFLQALELLLMAGSLNRAPSGMGEHGPKRNSLETENLCTGGRVTGFRSECGRVRYCSRAGSGSAAEFLNGWGRGRV